MNRNNISSGEEESHMSNKKNISSKTAKAVAIASASTLLTCSVMPASVAFAQDGAPTEPVTNGNENEGSAQYPTHAPLVETKNLDDATKQLENAKSEHKQVSDAYDGVKAEHDRVSEEYASKVKAEADAKTAIAKAEADAKQAIVDELTVQENNALEAAKALEDAKYELDVLTQKEEAARADAEEAQKKLDEAQKAYDEVVTRVGEDAEQELLDAAQAVKDAQAAYDSAVELEASTSKALEDATAELDEARQVVADASQKLSAATSTLTSEKDKLDAAESALQDAKDELAKYEGLEDSEQYKQAEQKVSDAKTAYDDAVAAVASAESDVTEKQNAVTTLQNEQSGLEKSIADAEKALTKAQGDKAVAEAQKITSQDAYDKAAEKAGTTAEKAAQAAQDKKDAETALSNAQTASENANKEVEKAAKARADKQKVVDELEAAAAAKTYDAWTFFESLQGGLGEDAIKVLNLAPKRDYTDKGNAKDATSLDNMKASVQWLKKCNELRAKHGLGALQVNYTLVAIAMINANYSSLYTNSHSKQFNVGENLAWNWGSDPFTQWYDDEKALADAGETDFMKIGHYKNIINASYTTTGFAISNYTHDNSRWPYTYAQEFSGHPEDAGYNKTLPAGLTFGAATQNGTVSIEQYEKVLDAYIESTKKEDPALTQAKAELQTAITAHEDAQKEAASKAQAVTDAQTALNKATTAEKSASDANTQAQTEKQNAESALNTAKSNYESKSQAAADAQSTLNGYNQRKAELPSLISQAQADKKAADEALASARTAVTTTKKAHEDAIAEKDALVAARDAAQRAVNYRQSAYDEQALVVDSAEKVRKSANDTYVAAVNRSQTAELDKDDAYTAHEDAKSAVTTKATALEDAKAAHEAKASELKELTDALGARGVASEQKGKADTAYNTATANRVTGETKTQDATDKSDAASQAYQHAQRTLVWDDIKDGGTGGAYATVDALISLYADATSKHEVAVSETQDAEDALVPIAARLAEAKTHLDASSDNVAAAQKIYDDAVDWNQDYIILDGDDAKYTANSGAALRFRFSGPVDRFVELRVDGNLVDTSNYTVTSGSTIVTLDADYMKTLGVGKHQVSALYTNGDTAEGEFEIVEKAAEPEKPGAGDEEDEKQPDGEKKDETVIEDDQVPQTDGKEQTLVQTGDDTLGVLASAAGVAALSGAALLAQAIGARRRRR